MRTRGRVASPNAILVTAEQCKNNEKCIYQPDSAQPCSVNICPWDTPVLCNSDHNCNWDAKTAACSFNMCPTQVSSEECMKKNCSWVSNTCIKSDCGRSTTAEECKANSAQCKWENDMCLNAPMEELQIMGAAADAGLGAPKCDEEERSYVGLGVGLGVLCFALFGTFGWLMWRQHGQVSQLEALKSGNDDVPSDMSKPAPYNYDNSVQQPLIQQPAYSAPAPAPAPEPAPAAGGEDELDGLL